jgi:hypothetical protein
VADRDHLQELTEAVGRLQDCLQAMHVHLGEIVIKSGLDIHGTPASHTFSAAIKSSRSYLEQMRFSDYRAPRPGIQMELLGVRISVK